MIFISRFVTTYAITFTLALATLIMWWEYDSDSLNIAISGTEKIPYILANWELNPYAQLILSLVFKSLTPIMLGLVVLYRTLIVAPLLNLISGVHERLVVVAIVIVAANIFSLATIVVLGVWAPATLNMFLEWGSTVPDLLVAWGLPTDLAVPLRTLGGAYLFVAIAFVLLWRFFMAVVARMV